MKTFIVSLWENVLNLANFIFFIIFFNFSIILLLFNYNCLHFPPQFPTPQPSQSHLLLLLPPSPLVQSMCPLWQFLKTLLPTIPSPSPLAIVRLFLTSMSLVIFYLLFSSVDQVPVKGQIIWYLSFTAWLISLSIMLSSSIHAVAKGISSLFLSAALNSIKLF